MTYRGAAHLKMTKLDIKLHIFIPIKVKLSDFPFDILRHLLICPLTLPPLILLLTIILPHSQPILAGYLNCMEKPNHIFLQMHFFRTCIFFHLCDNFLAALRRFSPMRPRPKVQKICGRTFFASNMRRMCICVETLPGRFESNLPGKSHLVTSVVFSSAKCQTNDDDI